MKLKEIFTRDPEVIRPDATLMDAAQIMNSLDVGSLPVCDGERLVGMVTDRDITVRGVAQGCDPKSACVRDVMTPDVIYCFDDATVKDAAEEMERRKVRRLPVLDRNNKLVGIVSLGDMAVRTGKERLAGEVLEQVSKLSHSGPRQTEPSGAGAIRF